MRSFFCNHQHDKRENYLILPKTFLDYMKCLIWKKDKTTFCKKQYIRVLSTPDPYCQNDTISFHVSCQAYFKKPENTIAFLSCF